MPRKLDEYLRDILSYSDECKGYVDGKTYLGFVNDDRLRRSVERTLQIVGEALWQAVKLDPTVMLAVSSSQQVIGLRHRLVHEYHDISDQILWAIAQDRLKGLDVEIENFLAEKTDQTSEEQ